MSVITEKQSGDTAIRPFHVDIPEEDVGDLRRRILATRLPEKEPVEDSSQGVQLAAMQALVRYWGAEYDLRRVETRLNGSPPGKSRTSSRPRSARGSGRFAR
jgi:epoxide hydrolase-like protein